MSRHLNPLCGPALSLIAVFLCGPLTAQYSPDPSTLDDELAPLGARAAGTTSVSFDPVSGLCRFVFSGGGEQREYQVQTSSAAVRKGLVEVYEARSGCWPLFRAGTARKRLDGSPYWAGNIFNDAACTATMGTPALSSGRLTLNYSETCQGVTLSKSVTYSLRGKTLLVEVSASGGTASALGNYHAFDLGVTALAGGRSLLLPYLADPVIVGPGVFASHYTDVCLSQANDLPVAGPNEYPGAVTMLQHYRYPRYLPDSAGRVQPLRERIYVTVSAKIEDVFAASNVPPSPHRAAAGRQVIYDTWGVDRTPANRAPWLIPFWEQFQHFLTLQGVYGLRNVTVLRHNWGSDYDFSTPKYFPANLQAGGDNTFAFLALGSRWIGWHFAAHEDYAAMFAPNPVVANPPWYAPAKIAKDANLAFRPLGGGIWNGTWIPAYGVIPADQVALTDLHSPVVHGAYSTDAAFLDVGTYLPPNLNLDASDPRATNFKQGIRDVKTAMLRASTHHQGPVSGEAYAMPHSWDLVYAGYVDGLERELWGGENGMVVPDVELRVFQPLQANQGVGYLGRFFADATRNQSDFPAVRHLDFARSRAVAYGHTGFINDATSTDPRNIALGLVAQPKVMGTDQILSEYYLHQALQTRMLAGPVASIAYYDGAVARSLGQKLEELRAAAPSTSSFMAAAQAYFRESRVGIRYANGLEVRVNCHRTSDWTVTVYGETWVLPPSGWLAINPAGGYFRALVARRYGIPGGEIVGWVVAPEYAFMDDRNVRVMTILNPGWAPLYVPY